MSSPKISKIYLKFPAMVSLKYRLKPKIHFKNDSIGFNLNKYESLSERNSKYYLINTPSSSRKEIEKTKKSQFYSPLTERKILTVSKKKNLISSNKKKNSFKKLFNMLSKKNNNQKEEKIKLNNDDIKSQEVSVINNILKLRKKSKIIINSNDIDLINEIKKQTYSNFNNKYKLIYRTGDLKKKIKIKQCFNLIQKGVNINEINNILNGPKQIISYKIQTEPNQSKENNFMKINERFNMKFNRIKKNIHNSKKITINALGISDPLINYSNSINYNRNMSGY